MGEYADWKDLTDRRVQIQKGSRTIRIGCVKDVAVSVDAPCIEGGELRALYENVQGHSVLQATWAAGQAGKS